MDSLNKDFHPRDSLRRQLVVGIGVPLFATFLLMMSIQFAQDRQMLINSLRHEMRANVEIAFARTESKFLSIEHAVAIQVEILNKGASNFLPLSEPTSRAKIETLLGTTINTDPFVFGAALAFAPGQRGVPSAGFAPYVYRMPGQTGIRTKNLADDAQYNFAHAQWFVGAGISPDGTWSEPYDDDGGGDELMTTYSLAFPAYGGIPAGVATADVTLAKIAQAMEVHGEQFEYGFYVVSTGGRYIATPNADAVMKVSTDLQSDSIDRKILDAVTRYRTDGVEFVRIGEGSAYLFGGTRLVFVDIPTTGWVFVGSFAEASLIPTVVRTMLFGPGLLLLGGIIALFIVWRSASRAVSPLTGVIAAIGKFATGDLSARAPATKRKDEIAMVSTAFNQMGGELQDAVEQRRVADTQRIAVAAQIAAARDMQRLLLPVSTTENSNSDERVSTEFPGISIMGFNKPANEMSGDFFDWFARADGTFALVIADVCGKGMAAAMMMAVCRTLLRRAAMESDEPHMALARVNEDLLAQAPESNFTTCALLYIDSRSGVVAYANAGHPCAILVRSDGSTSESIVATGTVLGIKPGAVWTTERLTLAHGEDLVLMSDGVTEAGVAHSGSADQFGSQRAQSAVSAACGGQQQNPRVIVEALVAAVAAWSHGFQGDDLTVIAISRD